MTPLWGHLNSEFNQRATRQGLEIPKWNATLWRYMELPKFLYMLAHRTLSLARLDKFEDQWEGFAPPLPEHESQGFFSGEHLKIDRSRHRRMPALRKTYYASCWHLSEAESDGMWKLYAKDDLAICTTYQQLICSLRNDSRRKGLIIGKVRYQRLPPGGSPLQAFMTKRAPFEHEKEVRVIWHDTHGKRSTDKTVVQARCDLKQLIKKVVVSPRSEQFFEGVVRDILEKYDLKDIVVTPSALSGAPKL